MLHTSCVAGAKPELPGRLDKASSTALSTALDTAEVIDLDRSGCEAIFAIIPALGTHVTSHMDVLRLLITY